MHETPVSPGYAWWHLHHWRRQWQRWRRTLYALVWPLVLGLLALSLHLYLANRAVVLWAEIQTLRAENWQLWWDIQTLAVQYAQRQQQALEELARQEDWQWPDPTQVLYLSPPSPTVSTRSLNTWTLPSRPGPASPYLTTQEDLRSLWDQLWMWWYRYQTQPQGRRELP